MIAWWPIIAVALPIASGAAVAYAIGAGAVLAYVATDRPQYPAIIPQRIFAQLDVFALLAMPLFILTGEIMNRSGITRVLALVRLTEIPTAAVGQERITILEADDDPLITPEARRSVTARYPEARVHAFASGGHFPYITRPVEYCRIVERRLAAG